jgi:DNA replication licensing factor MCM5
LSRFDLIFLIKDVRDAAHDRRLAQHVLQMHQHGEVATVDGDIPVQLMRKYITFSKQNVFPRISAAAEGTLENHYISIRQQMRQERAQGAGSTIPITVRQLEALVRISESFARMECVAEATVAHVEEAIELFNKATMDAANRNQIGGPMSEEQLAAIKAAEDAVRRKIPFGGKKSKNSVISELARDYEEKAVRAAIMMMLRAGELKERGDYALERLR